MADTRTSESREPQWTRHDRFAASACVLLFLLLFLMAGPFVEMPVHDEPSFVNLAFRASRTWRLVYDSFTLPIALVQAFWPAPFVALFGESIAVVRLSLLPFGIGLVLLQYWLARRLGLRTADASLSALAIVCCPLFLPLATAAMTDIASSFLAQACLALALTAALTPDFRRYRRLLALAALAGFLAGANRQIFWAVPALAIPGAAVCQWPRWRSWKAPVAIWCAVLVAAVLLMRWHAAQPFVLLNVQTGASIAAGKFIGRLTAAPAGTLEDFLRIALTLSLICLPALLPALGALSGHRGLRVAALAVAAIYVIRRCGLILAPWMGDMVNQYVTLPPYSDMVGEKPAVFPLMFRSAVTTGLAVCLSGWTVSAWDLAAGRLRAGTWKRFLSWPESPAARYAVVSLPFCAAYLGILLMRVSVEQIFDRYFLPVACVLVPLLFAAVRPAQFVRWRAVAWASLPVLGLYGLIFAHDQFALGTARLEAGRTLMRAGIPRACIGGGYEFDAWTQLDATGRMGTTPLRSRVGYWVWTLTPSVSPRYVVSASHLPPLADSGFAPVAYRTWAPPFQRKLWLLLDRTVACPDMN